MFTPQTNPLLFMQQLQASGNPAQFMQQQFDNDPRYKRAMDMVQGRTPEQMAQVMRNLAQQRGISIERLNQFLGQFGLKA